MLYKRLRRLVEGGLQLKLMKEFQGKGALPQDVGGKTDPADLRDCLSETLVVGGQTSGVKASRLGNYALLLKLVSVCLVISFMILIFENIYFLWEDNGEKRRICFRDHRNIVVY